MIDKTVATAEMVGALCAELHAMHSPVRAQEAVYLVTQLFEQLMHIEQLHPELERTLINNVQLKVTSQTPLTLGGVAVLLCQPPMARLICAPIRTKLPRVIMTVKKGHGEDNPHSMARQVGHHEEIEHSLQQVRNRPMAGNNLYGQYRQWSDSTEPELAHHTDPNDSTEPPLDSTAQVTGIPELNAGLEHENQFVRQATQNVLDS